MKRIDFRSITRKFTRVYYHKVPHPNNFVFSQGSQSPKTAIQERGEGIVLCAFPKTGPDYSAAGLTSRKGPSGSFSVEATDQGGLRVGPDLLCGPDGEWFGRCGDAWIMRFDLADDMLFYGLGEKNMSFEHRGKRTKMWNTDAFGDFAQDLIVNRSYDPMYVAIPWLIIRTQGQFVGILVENPGAVFFDLGSNYIWNGEPDTSSRPSLFFGAPSGAAKVWFLHGPSLPELTRRFQKLCGTTPLPPLWALGHHQCRWGYAGPADLREVAEGFRKHQIPNDGLWLDIDYMEGFRVFTLNQKTFRNPVKELAELNGLGQRVVAIIDPGVKAQKGYEVCDVGLAKGMFCRTPDGMPFSGYVWPGRTYFPDFSLPVVREWWAGHVENFGKTGFAGSWNDMNDPSIGPVDPDAMLFNKGKWPHEAWHNQYALGMAMATREGFQRARPGERPFVLSRSASTGSSRYTAVWCGDNVSNWHNLQQAIPVSLNLALSGIPFNGPDVCGFAENTNAELAIAWYQAGFLFPFFRNHTSIHTVRQEPWALGPRALKIIRRYIRLRYTLMPYLYQLFADQEERGEAILRPLFYDFPEEGNPPLGRITDQFLVGPSILQAPLLEEGRLERSVVLPGPQRWFCARTGQWQRGGRSVRVRTEADQTPLYFRANSLIPCRGGDIVDNHTDLNCIEIHCFMDGRGTAALRYASDDGLSNSYKSGARSVLLFQARQRESSTLEVDVSIEANGFGPCNVVFVHYGTPRKLRIKIGGNSQTVPLKAGRRSWTGKSLPARISHPIRIA